MPKLIFTHYASRITDSRSRITNYPKMKTHKDLDVWKEAMSLEKEIYRLTADFPKEEKCCSV